MAESKNPKHITPKGIAVYPRLNKPDTKFNPAGTYSVKLRMKQEDAQEMLDALQQQLDSYISDKQSKFERDPKNKGKKFKVKVADFYTVDVDDDGNETGYIVMNFKRTASGISKKTGEAWNASVAIFDAAKKPVTKEVWSGSLLKVAFESMVYDKPATGVGLTFRLSAAQVIKLVTKGSGNADMYGFDDETDDEDADTSNEFDDEAKEPVGTDSEDSEGEASDEDGEDPEDF